MNLQIKLCGNSALRTKAVPVSVITDDVRVALAEMQKIMDSADGVGLAAPQVGISSRFIVMREVIGDSKKSGEVLCMINPVITARSDDRITAEEGCLSVLGSDGLPIYANVSRYKSVTVEWIDENGRKKSREFSGMSARIAQHEIDHLDGVLFTDYLGAVKRAMIMAKVKKRKA